MTSPVVKRLIGPPRFLDAETAGVRLKSASRILLIKPHHKLGDLLVSTSLIHNLRLALPECRFTFVAGPYNAPAVLDNPDLDEVVVARLKGPGGLIQGARLARRLSQERFDAALVLSTISHSASAVVLARQARPGFVAGLDDAPYGSDLARWGYDCVVEPPADLKCHIVDYNLTLLERLNLPVVTREHRLGVTEDQRRVGRERLRAVGIDTARSVIGIQPGGNLRHPERLWPSGNYALLAQRARADAGSQVVLLGQAADRETLGAIQGVSRERFAELIDLPFAEYKGVLSGLDAFVTHDGGPVHVAAGVGTRSFFIFLSTPPWRWAPYGSHVHVWEEYTRPPEPAEAWARLEPLLHEAAGQTALRERP